MAKHYHQQNELQSIPKEEYLNVLACLNEMTALLKERKSTDLLLQQIANALPNYFQYPIFTIVHIHFDGQDYYSGTPKPAKSHLKERFRTVQRKIGFVDVQYIENFGEAAYGPFLNSENLLLEKTVSRLEGYLNSLEARDKNEMEGDYVSIPPKSYFPDQSIANKQLLQRYLNRSNYARDIYHDLMPFKVKEILLIANLYDAYSIEKEGRFSEQVLGKYYQLNLTSVPRITGVSSIEEALDVLSVKHYDLVIIMMGIDRQMPDNYSKRIKNEYPYVPIFLLLNNNRDIAEYSTREHEHINKVFIWNGKSSVFFTMIKHLEDKINIENDTTKGLVRVILVVEDDPKFYSLYLPMLYNIVMDQTRRIIDDVSTDELYKVLRLRARAKIILTKSYEEAIEIFNKYKEFFLCLITDVKFYKNGKLNSEAGFSLVNHIRQQIKDLPIIIQSSEENNRIKAEALKTSFINKNSPNLFQEFKQFIMKYLGFGNFFYKDKDGNQIAIAHTLKEFQEQLFLIPDESLIYHASKNHFSLWLKARGEIQVARIINPAKVADFKDGESLRNYLIETISKFRNEQKKGKLIPFEEDNEILDSSNIVILADGMLGGKGRGLSFFNSLLYNFDFTKILPDIHILIPTTLIIGTEEYDQFLDNNQLREKMKNTNSYNQIKVLFIKSLISKELITKLFRVVSLATKPLAIRSSGLLEDSLSQPFAGIFDTYILPNDHPDIQVRLKQLTDAIKLVYASIYSDTSISYVEAINYKIEEEKMAIIIQEVVGNQYNNVFYPHISGVAQSYNYYPIGHMKPEEGFANIALGLGKYVVEGEKSYRFSPKYPTLENFSSKSLLKNSQVHFYAVQMGNKNLDLLKGEDAGLVKMDIIEAESHGTLKHCASVYDVNNDQLLSGSHHKGPKILNFANILKHNYIPLASSLKIVLEVVKEAMGAPVEIEFAVNLEKDELGKSKLYILQIKPLIGNAEDYSIDMENVDKDSLLLYTEHGMGNGKVEDIYDLIYADINTFDKSKTNDMVREISTLNQKMREEGREYVLIGPGRWGTRDPWIGIPVSWPQISMAKIIVETSLDTFPLDASSGSHFFHNVTAADVGYFSVQAGEKTGNINWEKLEAIKPIEQTTYFKHLRFKKSLCIKMDGKKRIAIIDWKTKK
ncbi:MAG: pyruvate, phosphate dikinase [Bacteroidales bacterium]|nr:pyruvate, phosphate dikinase [Bacteroidales bacterium]